MEDNTAYITDSMGQKYKLVEYFNHDLQKWVFALEFVPKEQGE